MKKNTVNFSFMSSKSVRHDVINGFMEMPLRSDFFKFNYDDGKIRSKTMPLNRLNGEWDKDIYNFQESISKGQNLKFNGIKEHFLNGVPWRNTTLFQERYLPQLERNGIVRACRSLEALEAQYVKRYDGLYKSIKHDGFLVDRPIFVFIGRGGEIIYSYDGNHRLFIAIVLGLEYIPVSLWAYHANLKKLDIKIK